MESRPPLKLLPYFAAVGVLGVVATIAIMLALPMPDRELGGKESIDQARPSAHASESLSGHAMPLSMVSRSDPVPTLDELRRLCPNPWTDGLQADCLTALGRRYGREGMRSVSVPFDSIGWWWPDTRPVSSEIPWQEVFADPVQTRQIVEEALRRPTCSPFKAEPSPEPTTGQQDACAAREAAKLAMLHSGCSMMLVTSGQLDPSSGQRPGSAGARRRDRDSIAFHHEEPWSLPLEHLDSDASLTPEEYWQRRAQMDEGRFRLAWRRQMCRQVPVGALRNLHELTTDHHIHQGDYLRNYAARLGNEWALAVTAREQAATRLARGLSPDQDIQRGAATDRRDVP